MAKKKNAIQKVPANAVIPAYMTGEDVPTGTEEIREYVSPPRIKIVQKQANDELLEQFGVGDVIVTPTMVSVCEMERDKKGNPSGDSEGFRFTPLYFFPEWCTWNPISLKGKAPSIRERSQSADSPIAQKAKNPQLRREQHPDVEGEFVRHVEHLNFIVLLYDIPDLENEPVILSFSRSEHATGRRLCGLVRMRKAPLYGMVFEAHPAKRSNDKGDWWGLDVTNPPVDVDSWVPQESFEQFKKYHLEFAELHKNARIRAEYDDTPSTPSDEDDGREF